MMQALVAGASPRRRVPLRVWLPLAAVLIGSVAVAALGGWTQHSATGGSSPRAALLVLTLVIVGLLYCVARLVLTERLIEERARELAALSTHLQEFAEKEKSELARQLHEELGGLLTAAKMDLSWLQSRVAGEPVQQRLQQLGAALDEAMDVKRRVVEDLRPSLLDHFGLPTALRAYVEAVCGKSGLACEISITSEDSVPRDIAIALFRIVQEGLVNVIRHGGARTVRLALASNARCYLLQLSDDGRGFDLCAARSQAAHGLAGMRHRVWALGGRFTIESEPGRGSALRAEIPRRT
jgi:signal transduction histidine kinase